jgi:hypothetical protein
MVKVYVKDPSTGEEKTLDCTERHGITIEQALDKADARCILPKFGDISLTSGVTYINDADNYLRILEWLRRMKQTNTRP